MNKIIVIFGPTASGKSDLAVKLAKFFSAKNRSTSVGNGFEIISADSRQVYRGMNLGTGKITKKEMQGIPHHLLSIVSPKTRFTVAHFQKKASKKIKELFKKNKIPIIVGGTGFYIQAITDGLVIPHVKPNWQLRKKLEKKSVVELYKILKKIDPRRAKNIDKKNPRRLIRAIEIVMITKKRVPKIKKIPPSYQVLMIGIKKSKSELKKLIKKRLLKRLKAGMIDEVKKIKKSGVGWKRLEEFGLEYRWIAYYLQNKISYKEMVKKLQRAIEQFAKRQMTWFRGFTTNRFGKDEKKTIRWVRNFQEAKKLIIDFLDIYQK